jgi:drug/metabolite transporter (DMT)-like permease
MDRISKLHLSLLTLYCLLWALKDVLTKLFLAALDPVSLTFYLSLFSTFFTLILLARKRLAQPALFFAGRFNLLSWIQLGLMGVVSAGAFLTVVVAIYVDGPVLYSLVNSGTYPVFVAMMGFLFLDEQFPRRKLVGLNLAIMGVLVFQWEKLQALDFAFSGALIAALSALLFSLAITLVKQLLKKSINPEELLFSRFFITTGLLGGLLLVTGSFGPTGQFWQLGMLSLLGYTLPFLMSFYALRKVPISLLGVFVTTIPIISLLLSLLLLPGFTVSIWQVFGGAIVIAGVWVSVEPAARQR